MWDERFLDTRPLRTSTAFRDLWLGSVVAGLGQQVATVAVLLQVWELTRSPVWTGAIGIATGVPMLALGFLGGRLADAVDRRALVRVTTVGQLVAALGLAAQAFAGNRSALLLLVLVAVHTAFAATGAPARRTFAVRLLPTDQLAAGLALQSLAFQGALLVGPALAGVVLAAWGASAAYTMQAVAVLAALAALVRLPAMPVQGHGAGGPSHGTWRVIRERPVLSGSLLTDLSATLLAMPISLLPVVNELRFEGNPQTLGLLISAIAVGGIAAGLLSGTVNGIHRRGLLQLGAATTWGLALAAFGLAEPLWLALGCLAVAGAADTVSVVTRGAMIQTETPDGFRGRVSSVEHVIGVAGPDIGNVRGGVLAAATSAPFALVVGGLTAAAAVVAVAVTNRELRSYPDRPGDR